MKTLELERAAYMAGDTQAADLLARIAELEAERDELQAILDDIPSEKERNQDAQDLERLKDFFYECFNHLAKHYPCPEWSSDYDKKIIFDAISKAEGST